MKLPALLLPSLDYTAVAEDDSALLLMLLKTPEELILFFEYACDDETWSQKHATFMKEAMEWMTRQALQDRLLASFAKRISQAIQKHFNVLEALLPKNLIAVVAGDKIPINALLWSATSEDFRLMIREECRDRHSRFLEFTDLSRVEFSTIQEFVQRGEVGDLWRLEEKELYTFLQIATRYHLEKLSLDCQEMIDRYITEENVYNKLQEATENGWLRIKEACFEWLEGHCKEIQFPREMTEVLPFAFLEFSDHALRVFEALSKEITHLKYHPTLLEDSAFNETLEACPRLHSLDIGNSQDWSDLMDAIPSHLEKLNLTECPWLNQRTLKKVTALCPQLTGLNLSSNGQLNFSCWSQLKELKYLEQLDLSRCRQLNDEELLSVLQACRTVTHLSVAGCISLGDRALFEISRHLPRLRFLDVSHCAFPNSGFVELASRCKELETVIARRCTMMGELAMQALLENCPQLKHLDIGKNTLDPEFIQHVQQHYSRVVISV